MTSLDTTSSSEGSSPPGVPNAPKKKRVRRQQLELKQLRELAGTLELRLEQLKKRRGTSKTEGKLRTYCKIKYGPASVWEAIADRQFRERSRVEKANEELKVLLRTQRKLAQTLQSRAQKTRGDKRQQTELAILQLQDESAQYGDLQSEDEDRVFADLLTLVVRVRLEIQQRRVEDPRSVLSYATWGISVGEPQIREDSKAGLMLEMHGCSLLPFNVKTTAAACWKMFSLSPMEHKLTFKNETGTSDVVARLFTCSTTHDGRNVDRCGKHTCRKYVDSDGSVTIVFAGRTTPTDVQMPCQEVQIQRTGWIKVRPLHPEGPDQQTSTIVEMHSETVPRFRSGSAGQGKLARDVIDWVSTFHHVVNDWYRQTLSEVLVEEDWRAFRGEDTVVAI